MLIGDIFEVRYILALFKIRYKWDIPNHLRAYADNPKSSVRRLPVTRASEFLFQ